MPKIRWTAVVHYRHDTGLVDVTYDLEEIEHLHDLIELGPHWDTIEKIEITRPVRSDLTVEKAREL